jgi:hypothetical protein
MTSSTFEKIVTITTASIIGLNALMLMIDERISVFPYIFGLDIRYLLTLGLVGLGLVGAGVRRVLKK